MMRYSSSPVPVKCQYVSQPSMYTMVLLLSGRPASCTIGAVLPR